MVVTFAELAEQLNDLKADQNKKEREEGVNMDNILESMLNGVITNIDRLDSLAYTITVDNRGNFSIKEGLSFPSKESVTEEFKETEESIESYAFLVQEYRNELTKINNDIESLSEEYKKTSMQKIKLIEEINNAKKDFKELSIEAVKAFYMCYSEPSNQSTLKEKLIEVEYKKNSINDLEIELCSENEILNSIPEILEEKYCTVEEIEEILENLNASLQEIASSFYI